MNHVVGPYSGAGRCVVDPEASRDFSARLATTFEQIGDPARRVVAQAAADRAMAAAAVRCARADFAASVARTRTARRRFSAGLGLAGGLTAFAVLAAAAPALIVPLAPAAVGAALAAVVSHPRRPRGWGTWWPAVFLPPEFRLLRVSARGRGAGPAGVASPTSPARRSRAGGAGAFPLVHFNRSSRRPSGE